MDLAESQFIHPVPENQENHLNTVSSYALCCRMKDCFKDSIHDHCAKMQVTASHLLLTMELKCTLHHVLYSFFPCGFVYFQTLVSYIHNPIFCFWTKFKCSIFRISGFIFYFPSVFIHKRWIHYIKLQDTIQNIFKLVYWLTMQLYTSF